jgi:hypothetical protein
VLGEVVVRGRSNILIGVVGAVFVLAVTAVPMPSGLLKGAWVLLLLAGFVLVAVRSARMSVRADSAGLVVRNLARDRHVPWDDVVAIEATRGDNVTGAVTTIVIRRADGTKLVGHGASSYSRAKVEQWRERLLQARPRSA